MTPLGLDAGLILAFFLGGALVLVLAGVLLVLHLSVLKGRPGSARERSAFREAARVKGLVFRSGGFFRDISIAGRHRGRFVEAARINRRLVRFRIEYTRTSAERSLPILLRAATPEWPLKGNRIGGIDPVFESEFVLAGDPLEASRFLTEAVKDRLYAVRDVLGYFEVILYNTNRQGRGTLACLTETRFAAHEDIIAVMNALIQLGQSLEEIPAEDPVRDQTSFDWDE